MVVRFKSTYESAPITTNVVSSNPAHDEVYLMQQYVICGFLRFPPPIQLTTSIYQRYC